MMNKIAAIDLGAARSWGVRTFFALAAVFAAFSVSVAQAREIPASFADLAEDLLPAVVNISSSSTTAGTGNRPPMPPFPPGSPFEEFFEEFFENQPQNGPARRPTSLGSGFVIDPSGIIVTNDHVIEGADEIKVRLNDDRVLTATVMGRDRKTDIALLKVDPEEPLPFVEFGDSGSARVGDWIVAIGNPFGLGGTVTAGIISSLARDIQQGPYDDFIQTDASINRGNSGGPMFNLDGKVIGINTAIFSPSGGSVGIGFAVPSNLARQVVADLREYGRTRRGWLGVRIQTVSEDIAESLEMGEAIGALVATVTEGSPAADAGVEPGDVIISFDGQTVEEMRRLPRMAAEAEIGKTVDLVVLRDGERITLPLTIGELEEEQTAEAVPANAEGPDVAQGKIADLGIEVARITPELRTDYSLSEEAAGVVITDVEPNSAAAEKGLARGDVIEEIDMRRVESPGDVTDQVAQAREKGRKNVLLFIDRDQGKLFVPVPLTAG